ncbi:MAG: hypothetical protein ACI9EF_002509 [Pseudohongiellaceae bacterium]
MAFFVVYIREALALDSSSPLGGDGMPILEDASTWSERQAAAEVCMAKLSLEPMPALIDDLDDAVNTAYEGWPDRLYLVGKDGRIAMRGDRGPFGFKPDLLEAAIRAELGLPAAMSEADGEG